MTPDLFRELAGQFAEISAADIKYLVFRENYGFFDVAGGKVRTILENMSGIEYNGHTLPIEVATTLKKEDSSRDGRGQRRPMRREHDRRGRDRGGRDRHR